MELPFPINDGGGLSPFPRGGKEEQKGFYKQVNPTQSGVRSSD